MSLTPTPAAPSGELPDDYERWDGLREAVSDFRKATYEFARGQRPEDNDTMMAAQRRIFAEARAAVSQAAPEQATPECALKGAEGLGLCVGSCTKLGYCIERTERARALAAPSGAPKQEIPAQTGIDGDAWRDLFWEVAKALNCLPSSFVDANGHVIAAAKKWGKHPASTVQSAPVLPENDLVYDEVCRERGKLNRSTYVSSNAVNDVIAAVRRLAAAQSTPVQVEGQQEQPWGKCQVLKPSCDSALHAEPASRVDANGGDFLPRREVHEEIVLLSNVMREHSQLKSVIGREALLMRCVRKALATVEQLHSAGSARQGGEHAPEIVQALALPVAAAPEDSDEDSGKCTDWAAAPEQKP